MNFKRIKEKILCFVLNRYREELLSQVLVSLEYSGDLNPIDIVRYDGYCLSLLTTEQQNNKEIVLEAVKRDVSYLKFASQEIKDKIGNNNPVKFLEQWIKSEKQQEYLNRQLDKKEKSSKIKI